VPPAWHGDGGRFSNRFPDLRGRNVLLYLGRFHPHKNLGALLQAWCALCEAEPSAASRWSMLLAGPDQLGHRRDLESAARTMGLRHVHFSDPLYGLDKAAALSACAATVLPSLAEAFSVAALESLAYAKPIVLTVGCKLDVESLGAGMVSEPTSGGLAMALAKLVRWSDAQRAEAGSRGRAAVEESYAWPALVERVLEGYKWVCGEGGRPVQVLP
jgi:glycosyltransferase involved in cell wall biosynthesis